MTQPETPDVRLLLLELEDLKGRARTLAGGGAMLVGARLEQKFAAGDLVRDFLDLRRRARARTETLAAQACEGFLEEPPFRQPRSVSREVLLSYGRMAAIWGPGDPMRYRSLSYSHLRLLSQQRDAAVRAALAQRAVDEGLSPNQLQRLIGIGKAAAKAAAKAANSAPIGNPASNTAEEPGWPPAAGGRPAYLCTLSGLPITDLSTMVELRVSPAALRPGALEASPEALAPLRPRPQSGPAKSVSRKPGSAKSGPRAGRRMPAGGERRLLFADMGALLTWAAANVASFASAAPPSDPPPA